MEPKYSCIESKNKSLVKITNEEGLVDYLIQEKNLILCLEAKKINSKIYCIKCINNYQLIWSNEYNQDICDSNCSNNSFFKNNWCYKCNDIINGNQGCNIEKGCNYDLIKNEVKCNECKEGYFNNFNICVKCDDIYKGGIKGCLNCNNNNGEIKCNQCKEEFIFFENNKTCLNLSEMVEPKQFINCKKLSLGKDNKYSCFDCYENYSLLKEDNKIKCVNNNYIISPNQNKFCNESINIGTKYNPKYSCDKCINNYIEKEKLKTFTKIIYYENNSSYCDDSTNNELLKNCSEAIRKVEDNNIIFNCSKCIENNKLVHYKNKDYMSCQYNNEDNKCMVNNCKICKKDNNYFCSECILNNYEVNLATGSCIKKMEKSPIISWKDIFRLMLKSEKEINGRIIFGPLIYLRGITIDDISTGHAFLVNLIFSIKYTLRNLEERINVPTICEVIDGVNKTCNDINIVEYECIGNRTFEDYLDSNKIILEDIKPIKNDNNFLERTNFEEIVSEFNLSEIENKINSSFSDKNLSEIVLFNIDNITNQTSFNYVFNFTIDGQLNKYLEPTILDSKLKLMEINKTFDCKFNIRENQKANLYCYLNLEGNENHKIFTFKTFEIKNRESSIYLSNLDEVKLIHEEKEIKEEEENKKNNYLAIILIIGIIILTIAVVLLVICIKKSFSKKIDKTKKNNEIKNEEITKKTFGEELNEKTTKRTMKD